MVASAAWWFLDGNFQFKCIFGRLRNRQQFFPPSWSSVSYSLDNDYRNRDHIAGVSLFLSFFLHFFIYLFIYLPLFFSFFIFFDQSLIIKKVYQFHLSRINRIVTIIS